MAGNRGRNRRATVRHLTSASCRRGDPLNECRTLGNEFGNPDKLLSGATSPSITASRMHCERRRPFSYDVPLLLLVVILACIVRMMYGLL